MVIELQLILSLLLNSLIVIKYFFSRVILLHVYLSQSY